MTKPICCLVPEMGQVLFAFQVSVTAFIALGWLCARQCSIQGAVQTANWHLGGAQFLLCIWPDRSLNWLMARLEGRQFCCRGACRLPGRSYIPYAPSPFRTSSQLSWNDGSQPWCPSWDQFHFKVGYCSMTKHFSSEHLELQMQEHPDLEGDTSSVHL